MKRFDEYKTFNEVKAYMETVDVRTRNYLDPLPPRGLGKKYTLKDDTGEP